MTKRHRRHSAARKREVDEAYFNGSSMRALSQKYDACLMLIVSTKGTIVQPAQTG